MIALPNEILKMVQGELDTGESIKWAAQPNPKRMAFQTLPLFLFAIFWTGFALSWIVASSGFKIPDFSTLFDLFPLFGVPFMLIELAMLASRS